MPQSTYLIKPGTTADQLAEQRQAAIQMLAEASSTKPVQHWTQILGQMAKGGLSGYEIGEAQKEGRRAQDEAGGLFSEAFAALGGSNALPGATGAPAASAPVAPTSPASPASPAGGAAGAAGLQEQPSADMFDMVRKEEGFAPVAKWDVRQNSGGYGSKAAPGETFDQAKAEQYLQRDGGPVLSWVNANAPGANDLQKRALVSFGYNLGVDDLEKLKPDIQRGDWNRVGERMLSFNQAATGPGGALQPMDALTNRRGREAAMIRGSGIAGKPTSIGASAPDEMGLAARLYRNEATRPLAGKMLEQRMARANKKGEIVTIELGNGQKVSAMQMPDGSLKRVDTAGLGAGDGKLPPNFDDTQKLRKELTAQKNVAKFDDSIGVYKSMLQSAPMDSPASDLDLVNGLAKILDPESVVREGEFATVQRSQSIPDQLKGQLQFVFEGKGKLTPEARQKVMSIAKNRMTSYRGLASQDAERFSTLATRYGMDPDLIRKDFEDVPEWMPAIPEVVPPSGARRAEGAAGRGRSASRAASAASGDVERLEFGPDGKLQRVN